MLHDFLRDAASFFERRYVFFQETQRLPIGDPPKATLQIYAFQAR